MMISKGAFFVRYEIHYDSLKKMSIKYSREYIAVIGMGITEQSEFILRLKEAIKCLEHHSFGISDEDDIIITNITRLE